MLFNFGRYCRNEPQFDLFLTTTTVDKLAKTMVQLLEALLRNLGGGKGRQFKTTVVPNHDKEANGLLGPERPRVKEFDTSSSVKWTQGYAMPQLIIGSVHYEPKCRAVPQVSSIPKLERWYGVQQFVLEQLRELDSHAVAVSKYSGEDTYLRVSKQSHVEMAMYFSAFSVVERVLHSLSDSKYAKMRFVQHKTANGKFVGCPSAVLVDSHNKPVVVAVVEPPWACVDLKQYSTDQFSSSTHAYTHGPSPAEHAIHRTLAYMLVNHVEYGIVSNYNETRVLKINGGRAQLSNSVNRKSLGYTTVGLITAVILATTNFDNAIGHQNAQEPKHSDQRIPIISRAGRMLQHELVIQRLDSRLTTLCDGAPCKIKLSDYTRNSKTNQTLVNELHIYAYLKRMQGSLLPQCLAQGIIWGMFNVMVLEPFEPVSFKTLTIEHLHEMKELVRRLHQANICHTTITVQSFCLVQVDRQPQIRIMGLEYARMNPTREEQESDLRAVDYIGTKAGLYKNGGAWNASAPSMSSTVLVPDESVESGAVGQGSDVSLNSSDATLVA